MTDDPESPGSIVARLHRERTDPPFAAVLDAWPDARDDDAQLADLIEADGRHRLRFGPGLDLDRYLAGVPDLARHADALDAAIDMALRAEGGGAAATERLVAAHPAHEQAIRETAAINGAIWTTGRIQEAAGNPAGEPPERRLPAPFGPPGDDGRPRYELRSRIGRGSAGAVYLAKDRMLSETDHDALVAIKVLLAGPAEPPERRHRLVEEATKARRIEHPNVVRVLDRGVTGDAEVYVVQELVDGGDLARRRRAASPDDRDAARIVALVARGVHAAHLAGLVHCDLKPNNVLLARDGTPKISDFGTAVHEDRRDEEAPTALEGTLSFMSPEQFRRRPGALTIPTDVYALGGILFWLLTARCPNGDSEEEIARRFGRDDAALEPPDPLRHRERPIDPDLRAICRRALATRPADRQTSAAALAEDLERWLACRPLAWRPPGPRRRFALWFRRGPVRAIALLLAGVLLLLSVSGAAWLVSLRASQEFWQTRRLATLKRIRDQKDVLPFEVVPQLWLVEWLFGPRVFATGEDPLALWHLRVETAGAAAALARDAAPGPSLDAALWTTAHGWWLMRDDRLDEAVAALDRARSDWEALLPPEDRFLGTIAALDATARLRRALGAGLRDRAALDPLLDAIRAEEARLHGSPAHRSPAHQVLVAALGEAGAALDDAELAALAADRRRAFDAAP